MVRRGTLPDPDRRDWYASTPRWYHETIVAWVAEKPKYYERIEDEEFKALVSEHRESMSSRGE
jgi:hypothetical protein